MRSLFWQQFCFLICACIVPSLGARAGGISDASFSASEAFLLAYTFEDAHPELNLAGSAEFTEDPSLVIAGNRSLQLGGQSSARIDLPIAHTDGTSYLFFLSYRVVQRSGDGATPIATASVLWQEGTSEGVEIAVLDAPVGEVQSTQIALTVGDVSDLELMFETVGGVQIIVDNVFIFERAVTSRGKAISIVETGFPRLGRNQHAIPPTMAKDNDVDYFTLLEQVSRYHLITGFEDDPTFGLNWVSAIREISPDILLLPGVDLFTVDPSANSIEFRASTSGLFKEAISSAWYLEDMAGNLVTAANEASKQILVPSSMAAAAGDLPIEALRSEFIATYFDGSGLYDGTSVLHASPLDQLAQLSTTGDLSDSPELDLNGDLQADTYAEIAEVFAESYAIQSSALVPSGGSSYYRFATPKSSTGAAFALEGYNGVLSAPTIYETGSDGNWIFEQSGSPRRFSLEQRPSRYISTLRKRYLRAFRFRELYRAM